MSALHRQYRVVALLNSLNEPHWVAITLESDLPQDESEGLIVDSYERILGSFSKQRRWLIAAPGNEDQWAVR